MREQGQKCDDGMFDSDQLTVKKRKNQFSDSLIPDTGQPGYFITSETRYNKLWISWVDGMKKRDENKKGEKKIEDEDNYGIGFVIIIYIHTSFLSAYLILTVCTKTWGGNTTK
jgi:hypothetical protein